MIDTTCNPPCVVQQPTTVPGVQPPLSAPGASCDEPLFVQVCPPNPPVVIVSGHETCTGSVVQEVAQRVEAHIPAGTVIYTRPCPGGAEFDKTFLCDPNGVQVVAVTSYSLVGVPSTTFYNIDGSAYAGDVALLGACSSSLESDDLEWCFDGVNVVQWVVKDRGEPTGVIFWTDAASGVVIPTPTGPGLVRGVCPLPSVETPHLIYMERNGGVVTMADIVANTGARQVLSVTVKQISGRGSVTADAGSGVPFDAGETWSWSVVTERHTEYLTTSALTMDAGGGEQRITATYIR